MSYYITKQQKQIGQAFRIARRRLGININDAAELVGLTPEKLFGFENGTQYVRQNVINSLIKGYNVPKFRMCVGYFDPPLKSKIKSEEDTD